MSQGHDETENRESNFELQKSSEELSIEKESTEFDIEGTRDQLYLSLLAEIGHVTREEGHVTSLTS